MSLLEYFLDLLLFWPLPVGFPHIEIALLLPLPCLPSPPPCGWSTGFIAVPLTVGLIPFHLLLPALPKFSSLFSSLETSPIEAQAPSLTFLISEEGIFICTSPASLAIICAKLPALRAIFAPPFGFISIL